MVKGLDCGCLADITGNTSGHYRKLLLAVLKSQRIMSDQVDQAAAAKDADALYKAGTVQGDAG